MLSLSCTALGFTSKNEKYNPKQNILNGSYLKNLILQKVFKQQKIIKSNVLIVHLYFQCTQMMMNNISISGDLNKI